ARAKWPNKYFFGEDGETVVLPANIYGTLRLDKGVLYVNSYDSSEVLPSEVTPQLAEPCELSECDLWPRPKVLRFLEECKTFKNNPKNRLNRIGKCLKISPQY
ncbi:hypothetical protein MRX96_051375, partial [Rhipicephalus microplus]